MSPRKMPKPPPKPAQRPAIAPVTVRVEPATAARIRASRRVEVPPRDQWPARLRGHRQTAVHIAWAMAGCQWERLTVEGDGISVR